MHAFLTLRSDLLYANSIKDVDSTSPHIFVRACSKLTFFPTHFEVLLLLVGLIETNSGKLDLPELPTTAQLSAFFFSQPAECSVDDLFNHGALVESDNSFVTFASLGLSASESRRSSIVPVQSLRAPCCKRAYHRSLSLFASSVQLFDRALSRMRQQIFAAYQ